MRPYPARPAYGSAGVPAAASPAGGRNWPQVIVLQAIRIRGLHLPAGWVAQ